MKFLALMLTILVLPTWAQETAESPVDSMSRLRRWIEPDRDELSWEQIPWLESFGSGIVAADKSEKPLLLWVMNGHPLGCT